MSKVICCLTFWPFWPQVSVASSWSHQHRYWWFLNEIKHADLSQFIYCIWSKLIYYDVLHAVIFFKENKLGLESIAGMLILKTLGEGGRGLFSVYSLLNGYWNIHVLCTHHFIMNEMAVNVVFFNLILYHHWKAELKLSNTG